MAITKAICNKDFSSNSNILHSINFGVGGQKSNPKYVIYEVGFSFP